MKGRKLQALHALAQEFKINVFLTDIVLKETLNLLDEKLKEIHENYSKFRGKMIPFKDYLTEPYLNNFVSNYNESALDTIKIAFQNYINDIDVTILSVYQVYVSKIFNSYFEKKAPFGDGKKKSEFPDAFSLRALEDWCNQENEKIYVISLDGDMKLYCCSSERLHYLSDLSQFIDLINLEDNELANKVHVWFTANHKLVFTSVRDKFNTMINRFGVSIEGLSGVTPSLRNIELEQQIYSLYFPTRYAYAYVKINVIFVAEGLYSRSRIQKQLDLIRERTIDEEVNFQALWTVSYEVELELEYRTLNQTINLIGTHVLAGNIQLKLEEADKFIVF